MKSFWNMRAAQSIALLLSCVAVVHPLFDFDLYWHLAFGREIWNTGTIVQQEIFSHTVAGTPFHNRYWLAQWLFYALQQHFGWHALMVLKLLIVAGIAWLMFRTATLLGAGPWVTALIVPFCILIVHYRFTERPELFSLLLVACLAFLITGWRVGALKEGWLLALPPVMLVWDWLHGGIFGLAYLAIVVGVENYLAKVAPGQAARRPPRTLNRAVLLALAAMAINPLGLTTYAEYLGQLQGIGSAAFVKNSEYQPISLHEFKAFIAVLAIWCVLSLLQWRIASLPQTIAALAFAALATQITRVIGIALILVAPLLAALATAALARRDWLRPSVRAALAALGAIFLVEAYNEKFRAPQTPRSFGWGVADRYFPAGAARLAKTLDLQGRMFNSGHFGGYLAWELYPERRVFHYNNGNLFGDTYRYWRQPELLAGHDIRYAFIGNRQDIANFPPHAWAQIYFEPAGALVIKRIPEHKEIIRQFEVRFFHPRLTATELDGVAPRDLPRLFDEMAIYLAFREDARMAQELGRLAARHPQALAGMTGGQYLTLATQRHASLVGLLSDVGREAPQ